MRLPWRSLSLAVLVLSACKGTIGASSSDGTGGGPGIISDGDGGVLSDAGTGGPTSVDPGELPMQMPGTVTGTPTSPQSEDGTAFGGPAAPLMQGVQVVANRDSATIVVPAVAGASDFRVFRLPAGAKVSTVDGAEQVDGTVIHCAGYQQHNDKYTGTSELLRVIEVTNLSGPTDLVVEAIGTPCPFVGHLALTHRDIQVTIDELPVADRIKFSFFTEAELRARYGSLILNGHGMGPTFGTQGSTTPPKVLARTTLHVTPIGYATPRTTDFFEDFDGTSGPIALIGPMPDVGRAYHAGRHLGNSKWDYYVFNDHLAMADLWVDRGLLHVTQPDWIQDVFATTVGVPRRAAQLSTSGYLHVTFEVASNATSRRYWWLGLCGAEEKGKTFDADNHFTGRLVQTSFFYQPDGRNVSIDGWNCLQIFPRDGSPFSIAPNNKRSETDVRVMINKAGAAERESVVNLSPPQYPASSATPSWFRQIDSAGKMVAPILDDQLRIAPRTRFDVYIRRDRVVLFANGGQRLCNDFSKYPLTMAEAGVAYGQVLYHTAAERLEFSRSFNDRTGQRYYLENAPYADEREWDNVGFEENVGAPTTFDASKCFQAP